MEIIVLGILVGLDNLAVASGLGILRLQRDRRIWFAVSCSCFEALASVLGLLIGLGLRAQVGPAAETIGPVLLAAAGLLVLNAVVRKQEHLSILDRPLAMVLFPLILSLDNLTAGVGMGTFGTQALLQAVVVGIISGTMSAVGFAIGEHLQTRMASLARVFAGTWLVLCAACSLFADLI